jgi:hypothetical protein
MEAFAETILAKHRGDVMRSLQYLEHCIKCCYQHNDIAGIDKFAAVRDYIEGMAR